MHFPNFENVISVGGRQIELFIKESGNRWAIEPSYTFLDKIWIAA